MLERLVFSVAEADIGARRLEGGRRVARALAGRVTEGGFGTATGREDLREEGVSLREKAAEGGRTWIGSETMREPKGVRRPEAAGAVEGVKVWRGMYGLGVIGTLAYGEGSNLERGAKSRDCALLTVVQRGRLSEREAVLDDQADVDGGVNGEGEGLPRMSGNVACVIGARRDAEEEDGRRLEDRLAVAAGVKVILRVFVLLRGVGVLEPWKLPLRLTAATLLAGELPGVSNKLLPRERSLDITVDTESRSCRSFVSVLISPSTSSMSLISPWSVDHRSFMSDCNLRISPLTVNLSWTPLSMIARTLSIAGP